MEDLFTPWTLVLMLGLSFFFGLAYEEFHADSTPKPPGGVRSFPLLAVFGALLFALEPTFGVLCAAGLVTVGIWLFGYYRTRLGVEDSATTSRTGLMAPLGVVIAYAMGPTVLTQPSWVPVSVTVAAVLLMSARKPLHRLARTLPQSEIATLAQFLIIVGIVLPLLPDRPVTDLTPITPRQVWMAVVAISALSYASYLLHFFVSPKRSGLIAGALGGLYSSTATTVALSRRVRADPTSARESSAGIVLATSVMYLRLGIIVAVFNRVLVGTLLVPLAILFGAALLVALIIALRRPDVDQSPDRPPQQPGNPLQLGTAIIFALLFAAISIASGWIESQFGNAGLFAFAALLGVTDVDPFVISIAQGGIGDIGLSIPAAAILIAAASNNLLKAVYAVIFGGVIANRAAFVALVLLSVATLIFAGLLFYGWLLPGTGVAPLPLD